MDAEERTAKAISIIRILLSQALDDPRALIMLADSNLLLTDIEYEVYSILTYLEKTAPDKSKETEEQ